MCRKDAWPGAMWQPRPRSATCRLRCDECESGFGPQGFEFLSSVATALVVGGRFYGGGRLRIQRDGRNPIVGIRREYEFLEARPGKGRARIATPRRVQLRVGHDVLQVGVFGPAVAHDLRGGLDLPIGKGGRMRGKLGASFIQIRSMTGCTLIAAGAVNVSKRCVGPMRRGVCIWLVPDGWKFHPAMHSLAIESMGCRLRR